MSTVRSTARVSSSIGVQSIMAQSGVARPVDEPGRHDEEREFREHVKRQNGRGVIVDKTA